MTVYYTKDHEWISVEGDTGIVGISNYAQNALGDIVFIELPESGSNYDKGDEAAVVESVKAASEIYAPVSGTIEAVNDALEDEPALVNSSAEGEGWFYKVKLSETSELEEMMNAEAYAKFVADLD